MRYYYKVLEVEEDATQGEIKKAHRRLSVLNHPDKYQDQEEKLEAQEKQKQINIAYSILGVSEKRLIYDETGGDFSLEKIIEMADKEVTGLFQGLMKVNFDKNNLFNLAQDSIRLLIKEKKDIKDQKEREIWEMEARIIFLRSVIKDKADSHMKHLRYAAIEEIKNLETEIANSGIDKLDFEMYVHEKSIDILEGNYPREEVKDVGDDFFAINRTPQGESILTRFNIRPKHT